MTTDFGRLGRSCLECPSYLTSDQNISTFKKSLGSPMCARFGIVLGKPGLPSRQQDRLARYNAERCSAYGEPKPPLPIEKRLTVTLPDMDARTNTEGSTGSNNCSSCAMCKNYVPPQIVAGELGWTLGLCAAKGKLVLSQALDARDCEYRDWGSVRNSTLGLHLLPEFEDAFQTNVDPINAYFKNKGKLVEPFDYLTDRPVEESDQAVGIRAWRRILDPDGSGNETFLPIYDPGFFEPEEREKIPRTGEDEHPELYIDHAGATYLCAVAWRELDETPAAWGEAGCGKTELARYLAWLMCLPFERISITAQTELDDLAGKTHFSHERGTYFEYGRLPKAWMKPCVVVIDEPNVGPPDVWQFLRPLTDNSKQLVLDMAGGERLKRNDDCYMMMAMNPAWSPLNVGAAIIGDADASRLFHIYIDLPPAKLEREIIANRVHLDGWDIDVDKLDMIMHIADEVRDLCNDSTLPITWGIRPQIKVARALRWFNPVQAYKRAVGDYLEPSAQDALLDVVRSHSAGLFD